MTDHDHSRHKPAPGESLWKSRAGVALFVFAAVAGLLLAYEHRAHIFAGENLLIGLLILCVGMHFFMHGGHGGHGGKDGGSGGGGRP